MVRPRANYGSLRFSRVEKTRLLAALLLSLLAHLGAWGGYELGKKSGLWEKLHWPDHKKISVTPPKLVAQNAEPTIFIDVSQAATEAPKNAKYYSDKNSRAANPDDEKDSSQPKLNGHQRDVPKTEDAPRPNKNKPTTPAQPQKPVEAKPEVAKPAQALNPGALQPGKPAEIETPEQQPAPEPRPRTVREALAQQSKQLPGLQLQQDGGARQHRLQASLDAIASSNGEYDAAIIRAVTQRWYDLLDAQHFAYNRFGKVTVYFRLHPDGSITEVKITQDSVGEIWSYVCQNAIEDVAPFAPWSESMRRDIGTNFREIAFTFYYIAD
jgi:outer membrane biosynthesis protein TonB